MPGGSSLVKYSASASTGRQPSSVFAFSLSYTCPAADQPTTIRQSNLDDRNGARRVRQSDVVMLDQRAFSTTVARMNGARMVAGALSGRMKKAS